MASEYKVGMVAEMLGGGGQQPAGNVINLFSSPKQLESTTKATKKKKSSDAESPVLKASKLMPKMKAKKKKHRAEESDEEIVEMEPQTSKQTPGFKPPPGIVHEALINKKRSFGTKRKNSDSEDEDEGGITEKKRPRRDRLKKTTENRTIFVGNVPLSADKKQLTKLFREFGEIENVRFRCAPVADPKTRKRVAVIKKEFHDQRNNISAFICFKEKESAQKALTVNGQLIDGLHIRVDKAKPETKNLSNRSIFVGNLPFAVEEEIIRDHFEDCGEIENIRVIRDRKTNLGKGFCYVLFKSKDSVSLALALKKSTLKGRELRIQRCAEQSKKDPKKKTSKSSDSKKPSTGGKARQQKFWRPTNLSKAESRLAQKTALKKKWRKADKVKKGKNKVDEVTRVLGPLQQPAVKRPTEKKGAKLGKKGAKQGMKGKKAGEMKKNKFKR